MKKKKSQNRWKTLLNSFKERERKERKKKKLSKLLSQIQSPKYPWHHPTYVNLMLEFWNTFICL